MNPKTGLIKTRIRKRLRPAFLDEPKQTVLLNDLLEKHYVKIGKVNKEPLDIQK